MVAFVNHINFVYEEIPTKYIAKTQKQKQKKESCLDRGERKLYKEKVLLISLPCTNGLHLLHRKRGCNMTNHEYLQFSINNTRFLPTQ